MTIGDRSDHLMHHLRDRAEAAGQRVEDAAARVWADPAQLARLLDDGDISLALYWDLVDVLVPDGAFEVGPTVADLEAGIRAGRLAALPADVRARLERYVRERCAARMGL